MSVVFFPEVIRYAIEDEESIRQYYPYLVRALRKISKGTYDRVKESLLEKIQEKGLDTKKFEKLVKRLESVQYSDIFLLAVGFEYDFNTLLGAYNVPRLHYAFYFSFALKVKKIITSYKGEARKLMLRACIMHFRDEFYCNEELLRKIADLVSEYYEKIKKMLMTIRTDKRSNVGLSKAN